MHASSPYQIVSPHPRVKIYGLHNISRYYGMYIFKNQESITMLILDHIFLITI